MSFTLRNLVLYTFVATLIVFSAVPVGVAFMTSLKSFEDVYAYPPKVLPSVLYFENYAHAVGIGVEKWAKEEWAKGLGGIAGWEFPRYILNSLVVSTSNTLVTIMISLPAGYALARFAFRARRAISISVLLAYLMPQVVLLVPFYTMLRELRLIDTHAALIITYLVMTVPLAVWFLRGFFYNMPWELEDAAMIDGCSRVQALIRVTIPIALPGIVAVTLFAFITAWGEFLYALVYTGANARTAPIGIMLYITESGVDWGGLMAATVIYATPVAVIFLLMQKYFVAGLTAGALKK